jgi:SAM-dependent methyltransferase
VSFVNFVVYSFPNLMRIASWEEAYLQFETPEQEINKFLKRLLKAGAGDWPRDAEIVELFCGRGNGLHALSRLGFRRIEGIDLSPTLISQYSGQARCHVGDCRRLPFESDSKDILIVQGGLHHLLSLPGDLEETLSEARRVLRRDGLFVAVEPWLTPFLYFVHAVCRVEAARRLSKKIDALATMIDFEKETYDQWLAQPRIILNGLKRYFEPQRSSTGWGKLMFVGRKKAEKD